MEDGAAFGAKGLLLFAGICFCAIAMVSSSGEVRIRDAASVEENRLSLFSCTLLCAGMLTVDPCKSAGTLQH
jgi:hypothetical protein